MARVQRPTAEPGGYLSTGQWALWYLCEHTSRDDWRMRRPGTYPSTGAATARTVGVQRPHMRGISFTVIVDVWIGEDEDALASAEDSCAEAWQALMDAPTREQSVFRARSVSGPQLISDPADPAGLRWQASAIVTVET